VIGLHLDPGLRYNRIVRFRHGVKSMTTKERIHAEIDRADEERLDELYTLIRSFLASKVTPVQPSIMSKLKCVKIEGPVDFAGQIRPGNG
jgi:hypothetical protein